MIKNKQEKQIADAICNSVNYMSCDMKAIAKELSYQHRTLQQSFTRLCFEWLKELTTKKECEYDLRNETSVLMAKKIVEQFGDQMFLPFV